MYKTLGVRWLHKYFCPASAFVSEDKYEARNPQRFIYATVRLHAKKTLQTLIFVPYSVFLGQIKIT